MNLFDIENKNTLMPITVGAGVLLVVIFFSIFFAILNIEPKGNVVSVASSSSQQISAPVYATVKQDPFSDIEVRATAAYVLDVTDGKVLYEKNSEAQLPLASVAKVMTALVASHSSGDTIITVKNSDLESGAGGLLLSEKWKLKDLLDYMLVVSSNSGASAIARTLGNEQRSFVDQMNDMAMSLRLEQTFYLSPNGLDANVPGGLSGAYGSAKDMADLFSYIVLNDPELLSATAHDALRFTSLDGFIHLAVNTNKVAQSIPRLLASKTGLTDLAGGNLVVAFDAVPSRPIVVAVLGSTQEGRFLDVEKLVSAAIKKVEQESEI